MIKDLWRASDESYTNMNHLQTNHKGYTEEHWPEIAIVWTGQSEFSCTKTTKVQFSSIQAIEFDGFWEQKYNVIIEGTTHFFPRMYIQGCHFLHTGSTYVFVLLWFTTNYFMTDPSEII